MLVWKSGKLSETGCQLICWRIYFSKYKPPRVQVIKIEIENQSHVLHLGPDLSQERSRKDNPSPILSLYNRLTASTSLLSEATASGKITRSLVWFLISNSNLTKASLVTHPKLHDLGRRTSASFQTRPSSLASERALSASKQPRVSFKPSFRDNSTLQLQENRVLK